MQHSKFSIIVLLSIAFSEHYMPAVALEGKVRGASRAHSRVSSIEKQSLQPEKVWMPPAFFQSGAEQSTNQWGVGENDTSGECDGYAAVACKVKMVSKKSYVYYNERVDSEVKMTVDICYKFCQKFPGAKSFGLEEGTKCYCSPYINKGPAVDLEQCTVPCAGNSSEMCGGSDSKALIFALTGCPQQPVSCNAPPANVLNSKGFFSSVYKRETPCKNLADKAGDHLENSGCEVECMPGYLLHGDNSITCEWDGDSDYAGWAGEAECKPVNCGSPPCKPFSKYSDADVEFDAEPVSYTCNDGYTITGKPDGDNTFTATCEASGNFSASEDCIPVTCGLPPIGEDPHADIEEGKDNVTLTYGDKVAYVCKPGHTVDSYAIFYERTCLATGQLTNETCKPVECGFLPLEGKYENAAKDDDDSTLLIKTGDIRKYSCDAGFSTDKAPVTEAAGNGFFTVSCPDGIPDIPEESPCRDISCGFPESVDHAVVSENKFYDYTETVEYTCAVGFTTDAAPKGPQSFNLTCGKGGVFDGTLEKCQRVECGTPPKKANAEVMTACTDDMCNYEEELEYKCNLGYSTRSNDNPSNRTSSKFSIGCTYNGSFDEAPPCVDINDCQFPFERTCGGKGQCKNKLPPTGVHDDDWYCQCKSGYEVTTTYVTFQNSSVRDLQCTNINDCPPNSSFAYMCGGIEAGTCIDEELGYSCECEPGYHAIELKEMGNSTCIPMGCGKIPDVEHADISNHKYQKTLDIMEATKTVLMESVLVYAQPPVTYTCHKGFSVTGTASGPTTFNVSCSYNNGSVSMIGKQKCKPIVCGKVPTPVNAKVSRFSNYSDDVVLSYSKDFTVRSIEFECNPGFTTAVDHSYAEDTKFTVECQVDGVVTDPPKQCIPVSCGLTPAMAHANVLWTKLGNGTNASVGATESLILCGGESDDDDVNVTTAPAVAKANVSRLLFGETAEYTCCLGYTMSAVLTDISATMSCSPNGSLTPVPTCQPIQCGEFPTIENVVEMDQWKGVKMKYAEAAANLTAVVGYTQDGTAAGDKHVLIECLETGRYTENDYLPLQAVDCGPVPVVPNARQITADLRVRFPNEVAYECLVGYSTDAEPWSESNKGFKISCQANGNYTTLEVCKPVICKTPPTPPNTLKDYNGTVSYGGTADFVCKSGYSLDTYRNGSTRFSVACQPDGTFANITDECVNINDCLYVTCDNGACRDLKDPTGISPYLTDYTCDCDSGYKLETNLTSMRHVCININDCPEGACAAGGGVCEDLINAYQCHCTTGYHVAPRPGDEKKYPQDCLKQQCGTPLPHSNASVNTTAMQLYKDRVLYTCETGFSLSGNYSGPDPEIFGMECDAGGVGKPDGVFVYWRVAAQWRYRTNTPLACQPIQCGIPPLDTFAVRTIKTTMVYPQVVTYNCDVGYSTDATCDNDPDKYEMKCAANGMLEPLDADKTKCKAKLAGNPKPAFSTYSGGAIYYHDEPSERTKMVKCLKGYSTDGLIASKNKYNLTALADCKLDWPSNCTIMTCPGLPFFPFTTNNATGIQKYGDVTMYTCITGYTLTGHADGETDASLSCTHTGKFFFGGKPVICKPVACGAPPIIKHSGIVNPGNRTFNQKTYYECNPGYSITGKPKVTATYITSKSRSKYSKGGKSKKKSASKLNPDFSLTCLADGNYEDPKECLPVQCPDASSLLPAIGNAVIVGSVSIAYPQRAMVQCNPGYSTDGFLNGNQFFTVACLASGTYEKPKMCVDMRDCDSSYCDATGHGTCAEKLGGGFPTGVHIDDYVCNCDPGFEAKKVTIGGKEEWTCGNIPDCPEGACLPGHCKDLIQDYQCICPPGYSEQATEEFKHHCVKLPCGAPPSRNFSTCPPDPKVYLDQVEYTCETGYTLNSDALGDTVYNASCGLKQGGGVEYQNFQDCMPVACPEPTVKNYSQNDYTDGEDFVFPQKVTYTCDEGYSLDEECDSTTQWKMTCTAEGEIANVDGSETLHQCMPVSAGVPKAEQLPNAVFGEYEMFFGDSQNVSCNEGYSTDPLDYTQDSFPLTVTSKCGFEPFPTCQAVNCGLPPTVEHAKFDTEGEVTYPDVVTYTTDVGYTLDGTATGANSFEIACQANGQFESTKEFLPILVSCGPPKSVANATRDSWRSLEIKYQQTVKYECVKGHTTDAKVLNPQMGITAIPTSVQRIQLKYMGRTNGLCMSFKSARSGSAGCESGSNEASDVTPYGGSCKNNGNSDATLQECSEDDPLQLFTYDESTGLLQSHAMGCVEVSSSRNHRDCEPYTLRSCDINNKRQQFRKESHRGFTIWRNVETNRAIDSDSYRNSVGNWIWACSGSNSAKFFNPVTVEIEQKDDSSLSSNGEFVVTCQADGNFSAFEECKPIICPSLPVVAAADSPMSDGTSPLVYGQSAPFKCRAGYSLDGKLDGMTDFDLTCQESATFPDPPVCKNMDNCADPSNQCSPNGRCEDNAKPTGSKIDDFKCICDSGFEEKVDNMSSQMSRRCRNIDDCTSQAMGACGAGICIDLINDYRCDCDFGYFEINKNHSCAKQSCDLVPLPKFATTDWAGAKKKEEDKVQCTSKLVDTPNNYNYYLGASNLYGQKWSFEFEVMAKNDAHIFLGDHSKDNGYEIVIGGWRNSKSIIRAKKQGKFINDKGWVKKVVVDKNKYVKFAISRDGSKLTVTREGKPLMTYSSMTKPVSEYYVATGWGATGKWKLRVCEVPLPTCDCRSPNGLMDAFRNGASPDDATLCMQTLNQAIRPCYKFTGKCNPDHTPCTPASAVAPTIPNVTTMGPPAKCTGDIYSMPTTFAACARAAKELGKGIRDTSDTMGNPADPICAVVCRDASCERDPFVRFNSGGKTDSNYGAPWRAVCAIQGSLPATTTTTSTVAYAFVNMEADKYSAQANWDGSTKRYRAQLGTVKTFAQPAAVVGFGSNRGKTRVSEWANLGLAGSKFVIRPFRRNPQKIILYAVTSSKVTVKKNSKLDKEIELKAGQRQEFKARYTKQVVDIESTGQILVSVESYKADYVNLVPAASTIYGSCSRFCYINVFGGENAKITEKCTDGKTRELSGKSQYYIKGPRHYTGKSCSWSASGGALINGYSWADADGIDGITFLPSVYFQEVTPVPVNMQYVKLISNEKATCEVGTSKYTLSAQGSGVYHRRLGRVGEGTVIKCDKPVQVFGDYNVRRRWRQQEFQLIVCKAGMNPPMSFLQTEKEACKSGWTQGGDRCYKYVQQRKNFDSAEAQCKSMRSTLAKIESAAENSAAAGLLGSKSETLIGYKQGRWSDGTEPSWKDGWQPSWHEKKQPCTRLMGAKHHWKPTQWDDWSCDKAMRDGFVCSYDTAGPYYQMKKGSCCCPVGDRIKTKEECASAHDALGLKQVKVWEGRTSGIPGGCSTRQDRAHDMHWNKLEPGRSRYDMTPICKKATCFAELYQHGSFNGWKATFTIGEYNKQHMKAKGAKNDDASSIKVVGKGCKAELYEHDGFTGWKAVFSEGSYPLSKWNKNGAKNDAVTSIKVYEVVPGVIPMIPFSDMTASQKNVAHGGSPERALTTNPSTRWRGTCTHTSRGTNNWWKVSLSKPYDVKKVVLTNRAGCCPDRLQGVDIYAGGKKCASGVKVEGGASLEVPCVGQGSEIKVVLPKNSWFTICGFKAYGTPADIPAEPALPMIPYNDMTAEQVNVAHGGQPGRALTTSPSTRWSGSCTHTGRRSNPWWKVSLKKTYDVKKVVLTNRAGCCPDRLQGVDIYAGSNKCASGISVGAGATLEVPCEGKANSIKVVLRKNNYLTICGFRAYGTPDTTTVTTPAIPMIPYTDMTASQVTTAHGGPPGRALTDKPKTRYGGTCTHTSKRNHPWWKVSLKKIYDVKKVVLTNRAGCCPDRLQSVDIYAGSKKCASGVWVGGGATKEVPCVGTSDEIKVVLKKNNYLTICGFRAYGTPAKETSKWRTLYSKGSFGNVYKSKAEFNRIFQMAKSGIARRECKDCGNPMKDIYFRRKKDPSTYDAWEGLMVTWRGDLNFHTDFDLYSSLEDALADKNAWKFCNGNDRGIGFPRDCGPERGVAWTWTSLTRGGSRSHYKWTVLAGSDIAPKEPPAPKDETWTTLYSRGTFGNVQKSKAEFNKIFQKAIDGIARRECTDCTGTHKDIYYRRKTNPSQYDAYQGLLVTWRGDRNFHTDFDIYSSLEDAVADKNPWKFCNGNDRNIGFPRDCGPKRHISYTWTSLNRHGSRKNYKWTALAKKPVISTPPPPPTPSDPDQTWKTLYSKGRFGDQLNSKSQFNKLFREAASGIAKRECEDCPESHKEIYYKRKTDPEKYDAWEGLMVTWRGDLNFHKDFDLYSSLEDALAGKNAWKHCNGNDRNIGFPRDCGPNRYIPWTWTSLKRRGGREHYKWSALVKAPVVDPKPPPTPTDKTWKTLYSKGSFGDKANSKTEFNRLFRMAKMGIARRECTDCAETNRDIYYRRKKDPSTYDAWEGLMVTWRGDVNFHKDFDLYGSLEDALADKNAWKYCNGNDRNIGFPRDCGPTGYIPYTWTSLNRRPSRVNYKWSALFEPPQVDPEPPAKKPPSAPPSGGTWAYVNMEADGKSYQALSSGAVNEFQASISTIKRSTDPSVVVGFGFNRGGKRVTEWANLATAGRKFVIRPGRRNPQTFVVYAVEAATVTVKKNNQDERTIVLAKAGDRQKFSGSYANQVVEFESTGDILVSSESRNADYVNLVPVASTLYGSCSRYCWILVHGGERATITQTCNYGRNGERTKQYKNVAKKYIRNRAKNYRGRSCKWSAPEGVLIAGYSWADGDGVDGTAFLPAEYFQKVTPVPLDFQYVKLISDEKAECTFRKGKKFTLNGQSGGTGSVYDLRVTDSGLITKGTVIKCDKPVQVLGDFNGEGRRDRARNHEFQLIVKELVPPPTVPPTPPSNVSNGTASNGTAGNLTDPGDMFVNDTALFNCFVGYTVNGLPGGPKKFKVDCKGKDEGEKGITTGMTDCKPVKCGAVPPKANATANASSLVYPQTVTYTCAKGYSTKGTCSSDSKSSFTMQCSPTGAFAFLDSAHTECKANLAGHISKDMLPYTTWRPTIPVHYPKGFNVRCRDGFSTNPLKPEENTFSVKSTPTCSFEKFPKCAPVSCGKSPSVQYASGGGNAIYPQRLYYKCMEGYTTTGQPNLDKPSKMFRLVADMDDSQVGWDVRAIKFVTTKGLLKIGSACSPIASGSVEGYGPEKALQSKTVSSGSSSWWSGKMDGQKKIWIGFECKEPVTVVVAFMWQSLDNPAKRIILEQSDSKKEGWVAVSNAILSEEEAWEQIKVASGGTNLFSVDCTQNGTYSPPSTCKPVTCGAPPALDFAQPTSNAILTFQETVKYKCLHSYTLGGQPDDETEFTVTCGSDGKFDDVQTCKPISCDPASSPTRANSTLASSEGVTVNETVLYTCKIGFSTDGKPNIDSTTTEYEETCQLDGTLSSTGSCKDINWCSTPDHCGIGGKCIDRLLDYDCNCSAGYKKSRNGSAQLSRLMCVEIDECTEWQGDGLCTDNGKCIDGVNKFTCDCDEGYVAKPATNLGGRSGEVCRAKLCGETPVVPNAFSSLPGRKISYDTCVTYICKPGYSLNEKGGKAAELMFEACCLSTGNFSEISSCKPVKCPMQLPTVENASVVKSPDMPLKFAGGFATYRCDEGHTVTGIANGKKEFRVGCLGNGQFSKTPTCKPVTCGHAPGIPHAAHSGLKKYYLQKETYECQQGYTVDGTPEGSSSFAVDCTHHGNFSEGEACQPVQCGGLSEYPNAHTNTPDYERNFSYPEIAQIGCMPGYTTNGKVGGPDHFVVQCKHLGDFIPIYNYPLCKPVPCGQAKNKKNSEVPPPVGLSVFNESVGYTCKAGYSMDGKPEGDTEFSVDCQSNGKFSGGKTDCKDIDYCFDDPCGTQGKCHDCSQNPDKCTTAFLEPGVGDKFKDQYSCLCNKGHEPEMKNGKLTCTEDDCTGPDGKRDLCGPGGSCIDLSRMGKDDAYTCYCNAKQGYKLKKAKEGDTCVPVKCADEAPTMPNAFPPLVRKSKLPRTGKTVIAFDKILYKCAPGYSTDTTTSKKASIYDMTCGANGRLSKPKFCQKIKCDKANLPAHPTSKLVSENKDVYVYKDTVLYSCIMGYELGGKTPKTPIYRPPSKPKVPTKVPGTKTAPTSKTAPKMYPTSKTFSMPGKTKSPFSKTQQTIPSWKSQRPASSKLYSVECLGTGFFSNAQVCKPVSCGVPKPMFKATMSTNQPVSFPALVTYTCQPGYVTPSGKPSFMMRCSENKIFTFLPGSKAQTGCKPIQCKSGGYFGGPPITKFCAAGQSVDGTPEGDKFFSIICNADGTESGFKVCQDYAYTVSGIARDVSEQDKVVPDAKVVLVKSPTSAQSCGSLAWPVKFDSVCMDSKFEQKPSNQAEAATFCTAKGARLCTKRELQEGTAFLDQCGPEKDATIIWTSTPCEEDGFLTMQCSDFTAQCSKRDESANSLGTCCADESVAPAAAEIVKTTNVNGKYTAKLMPGNYIVYGSKPEFINSTQELFVNADITASLTMPGAADLALTPEMEDSEWRFVLKWGLKSRDLDSWTIYGDGTHCDSEGCYGFCSSWWNYKEETRCNNPYNTGVDTSLDVDMVEGYGVESTIIRVNSPCQKTMINNCAIVFMVDNYTPESDDLGNSHATVTISKGKKVVKQVDIPKSVGAAINYPVATIDAETGTLYNGWECIGSTWYSDCPGKTMPENYYPILD